jgi:ABC-type branched-chain amino acid transport systems, periplasmic component
MPRPLARAAFAALAVASVTALVGCTTGGPTPTPTPTPVETFEPTGDGVLKIGTLFPSSGGLAFLSPGQVAGVRAAVRDINAAGGVNGEPVVVVSLDSGDASSQKAEESFAAFVEQDVDVVIGPSSSVLAQRLLGPAEEAGIPLISPAATYPQLTVLDDADVFFRTIPSYPHQALVLADHFADADDVETVAVVYSAGDLGESFVAAFEAAARAAREVGVDVAAVEVPSDAAGDALATLVTEVKDAEPDAVVLATPDNGDQTKALITQLISAGYGGAKLWLTSQNLADYSQALSGGLLNGVNGILEGAAADDAFIAKLKIEDPGLADARYGAEAYDATVLAALAAVLAGDDDGPSVARHLVDASVGGIKCTSFGECVDVLVTQTDIDYDGISGSTNFDAAGDPVRGTYQIMVYNGENKYGRSRVVVG